MISDAELEVVVRRVIGQITAAPEAHAPPATPAAAVTGREPLAAAGRRGLFATVDEAVGAARAAQTRLAAGGIGLRRRLIDAIRAAGLAHAEDLARAAHEETGLGRVRDKVAKNQFAAAASLGVEDLAEPRLFAGEHGTTIEDWLPWGVVASVTPTNSPSAFIINHAITMLAGGNAVVFNCHPGCKWTSMRTVEIVNDAIVTAGGPDNLATGIVAPTLDTARELVSHDDVDMLVVTGGAALVQHAFASTKRVIAAGPGLPVAVVDDTADATLAAEEIFRGAVFDNTILCIGEKTVVSAAGVYTALMQAFAELPTRILTAEETERVYAALISTDKDGAAQLRREFVGRDAEVLLAASGLDARKPVGLLVAPVEAEHPLVRMEQFCPFLPVVRVADSDSAIDLGVQIEGGNRHTVTIYSNYPPNVERFVREAGCVLNVVNGCSLRGLGVDGEGYPGFAIGTITGEGVTAPRHFVMARRTARIR